jgi:nucleoside-diphosphate-sugar epimerase
MEALRRRVPLEAFEGKSVVVTGAAGFVPSYLVEALLTANARVIAVVRNYERGIDRFKAYRDDPRFSLRVADATDEPPVGERIDMIFHAASQASPKYYKTDPVGTLSANVFGTQRYLELARRDAALFFYFSSGDVYGVVDRETIAEGDYGRVDPVDVRSCYGESKRMAETMCVAWHAQYGVQTRIARIFHTYGPGMRLDDGRVFADFVADILAERDIVMLSDGSAVRAYCYLEDAIAGYLTIALDGAAAVPYNVGNDEGVLSVLELAELLVALYPERGLRVIRQVRTDETYLPSPMARGVPDTTALRGLGWRPLVEPAEGFRRTIASYADA